MVFVLIIVCLAIVAVVGLVVLEVTKRPPESPVDSEDEAATGKREVPPIIDFLP